MTTRTHESNEIDELIRERRTTRRVDVDLCVDGLSAGETLGRGGGNIGPGGFYALDTEDLEVGQILSGHILLPDGTAPIKLMCEVAHVSHDSRGRQCCGARFIDIAPWDRQAIVDFMDERIRCAARKRAESRAAGRSKRTTHSKWTGQYGSFLSDQEFSKGGSNAKAQA